MATKTDTVETADTGSAAPSGPRTAGPRRRTPKFMLAIPAWAWFIVFFAVPVGFVLLFSLGQQVDAFTQRPNISPSVWSLDNFSKAIDPAYMPIFWRTLQDLGHRYVHLPSRLGSLFVLARDEGESALARLPLRTGAGSVLDQLSCSNHRLVADS